MSSLLAQAWISTATLVATLATGLQNLAEHVHGAPTLRGSRAVGRQGEHLCLRVRGEDEAMNHRREGPV